MKRRAARRISDPARWLRSQAESDFQAGVLEAARALGWLAYHVHDSRRDEPGFPDLVLVGTGDRRGRCIVAELKAESGAVRPEQAVWLGALMLCPGIEVHTWRPRDMDRILEILQE